ncbi:MAG: DUF3656 domain-containing protein [Clostridiales bacterium]
MNKAELLLPAGKFESLKAALANGADAVYLGGSQYGARAGAGNFNDDEMKKAVKLCHSRGVKIYVTMNTLLSDDELAAALDYGKFLYDLGVDALIVQDLGLAGAIKKLLPNFRLHSSTQMSVHNVVTAKWAYKFGFKRVILAREMTLAEIKEIREAVPELELEVFCHGAICICYSGQCLMSSLIGGRSGNRGFCAQPCRMNYQLWDNFQGSLSGEPSHLLSPRDMNTLEHLKELTDLGVVSFKVEGRMRRPEYVASVGRVYRHTLDSIETNENKISQEDKNIVEQVFNRDFTTGYLHGNPGINLMSHQRPNNRGVLLGRVKQVDGKIITLDLEKQLKLGDGIEIWVKVGGRIGCTVSDIRVDNAKVSVAYPGELAEIQIPGRIGKGDRVFMTYDSQLMNQALDSYENLDEDVALYIYAKAELGKNLYFKADDQKGNTVELTSNYIVEAAKKTPTDIAMVKKQLSRLGGSGFFLQDLTADLDENIILPASVLNNARREIVEKLDNNLFRRYPVVQDYKFAEKKAEVLGIVKEKNKHSEPKIGVKVRDIYQMDAALDSGADTIYFAPHFGLEDVSPDAWKKIAVINEKYPDLLVFALPRINQDAKKKKLYENIENALEHGFTRFLLGQTGDIELKEKYPMIKELRSEFSQNVYNNQTAKELYEMGYSMVTASLELTKEGLEALSRTKGDKEVIVHGRLPMMVSRHCLIGAVLGKEKNKVPCGKPCHGQTYYLKDRMDMLFPVLGDRFHNFYVYNCKDLALIDELNHLLHFQSWRIEGQFYDIGSLKETISLYLTGREQVLSKGEYQKDMLFSSLQIYSQTGFTKGHFYRGVQ